MLDFDAAKNLANIAKHGVSLSQAFEMDTHLMITLEDRRFAYDEDRWISIGPIGEDIYVLAHTYRDDRIRPISLRKAERLELKIYRESWG